MAIYYFSKPEGQPVIDSDQYGAFKCMADDPQVEVQRLHTGTHDITPSSIRQAKSYLHTVIVTEFGTAVYHAIPVGGILLALHKADGNLAIVSGEHLVSLPDEQPVITISASIGDSDQELRMFAAVMHVDE